jgi:tRNA (cmo5U34)-methyltransferase
VADYVARMEVLPPRAAGEAMLVDLLPAHVERVLDLGTGDGRLVARVLEARPAITHAVAVDRSEPMLQRARQRFADDDRVTVAEHDLTADVSVLDAGAFDLVVSGFAIHHLEHDRKRELFGEVRRALRPGGLFANLEVVASATPRLHAEFLAAIGRDADDPEDRLAPVDAQLRWMDDAGLVDVDCFWRWRGFALLAGRAPGPR